MTRQQLAYYMNEPGKLDERSLPEIIELAKEFPYFQTAWLLIAKNLKNIEHLKYPHILHTAAAYAGDRKRLKQLLELPSINSSLYLVEPQQEQLMRESLSDLENSNSGQSTKRPTKTLIEEKDNQKEPLKVSPDDNILHKSETEPGIETSTGQGVSKHTESDKKSRNELIEKFLQDEPSISQLKHEFFSPHDMAKQSMSEHEDIVSETLAEIYIKQGMIDKAIKIFEKLIVIIPEKSSYFASRIKELK